MSEALVSQFESYLLVERRVARNTFLAYKTDIAQFMIFLQQEDNDLQTVQVKVIKKFLQQLKQQNLSARSLSRKISSLKAFFHYLFEYAGMRNVAESLIFPKLEQKLPHYITEADVELLLRIAGYDQTPAGIRNKIMVYLLYVTGMRITEMVSLKVSDIQFDMGFIAVAGKGGKHRMIPLPDLMKTLLKEYIELIRPQFASKTTAQADYLFLTYYAQKTRAMTRQAFWVILKNLWKRTGLKQVVSPHTLRHSFATHMLKHGANLRSLQLLLGHENLATVQIYTHVETSYLRQVYDKKHPRS